MKSTALYLWTLAMAFGLALSACNGGSSPLSGGGIPFAHHHGSGSSPIQHVVVMIQENRSFDNLFATFPGANGAKRGKEKLSTGDRWVKIMPTPLVTAVGFDLTHCHSAFLKAYDGGNMDGFNLEHHGACPGGKLAGKAPYHYVKPSQIAPYWDIADQWVLGDAMFQSQGSGSFTAHQDLIRGGTCIQGCSSPSGKTESLIDNPTAWPWGCDAGSHVTTYTIDIYGDVQHNGPFPCSKSFPNGSSSYPTLGDLLDAHGVSWKYYTPCFSASKQPGCSPSSDCPRSGNGYNACDGDLLNAFDVIWPVRNGPEWGTNVSWPETNIFTDIDNSQLPAVSWVIPEDDANDHPGQSCHCDMGPEWVASVVNAIGESKYWNSTVVVVVWDDWGGFYDHVVPPQYSSDVNGGLGFRVPMLVVSPYDIAGSGSQGGYVSHTQYEFASILAYIENNWNLGNLGTTDVRAKPIDDVFNYSQSPRAFTAIPSSRDKQYFINRPHVTQRGDPQ